MTAIARPVSAPVVVSGVPDALRSERTKLRTVMSSWWTLLIVLVGTIGIGAGLSWAVTAQWNTMTAAEKAAFDPTFRSLTGVYIAQVAIGILGVLAITSEYTTGMIRTTFAAVPRRRLVLAAKAVAVAVPAWVVSTIGCLTAFLVGQAILSSKGIGVSITQASEVRAVLGGGLYLTALALFGLALGAIFRRTAGAIGAFIGAVLVLPTIALALPSPWNTDVAKYLPANAGQALLTVHHVSGSLSPWTGFAVLCAWVGAAFGVAAWLIVHRDA